jgi:polyisoprenoid-binding protein YceI
MKFQVLSAVALAAVFMTSCGGGSDANGGGADSTKVDSLAKEMTYTIDPAASTIRWAANVTGAKVYGHFGTIGLNNGTFTTKGGQLVAGTFEVNMKAITPLDSNYAAEGSEQGTKANLIGHLATGEFFLADSFPTSTFKVTSVEGNTATGELSVRGKTNTEKVTDIVMTEENGTAKATGKLVFDRQKYGVAWKHYLKDAVLSDNIELEISLSGKAQ